MRLDPPSDHSSQRASPTDEPDESVGGNAASARRESGMTPEHQAEVRRRVLNGSYNASGIIAEVARRLLASGDLSR